jgi:carbamoyl-phosphate synthase small subunit
LEDGSVFRGRSIGIEGVSVGEVVFNTAMTGYQEILTDPSYARQIVTLTYPQIGNTGINPEDVESDRVWASGLVIRQTPRRPSNWRMTMTLQDYLRQQGVVAIADVDTRRLTQLIREKGALAGCIAAGPDISVDDALRAGARVSGPQGPRSREGGHARGAVDLAPDQLAARSRLWRAGAPALPRGRLRLRHQAQHPAAAGRPRLSPDGRAGDDIGGRRTRAESRRRVPVQRPGDPEPCDYAIAAIREFLARQVPTFGICLGHQLLALASGARTLKMSHGHHGANHPVKDLRNGRVVITSQNHGFAVAAEGLPDCLTVTHVSLFDGTLQGIRRTDCPALGFQGHPEASPGPEDCAYLFDEFIELMEARHA